MADVCLWSPVRRRIASSIITTYVDLPCLESFFKVVVDRLIRDLADESEIRDAHLFLFGALEYSLPDLRLAASAWGAGLCCRCILFAASAPGDALHKSNISMELPVSRS